MTTDLKPELARPRLRRVVKFTLAIAITIAGLVSSHVMNAHDLTSIPDVQAFATPEMAGSRTLAHSAVLGACGVTANMHERASSVVGVDSACSLIRFAPASAQTMTIGALRADRDDENRMLTLWNAGTGDLVLHARARPEGPFDRPFEFANWNDIVLPPNDGIVLVYTSGAWHELATTLDHF